MLFACRGCSGKAVVQTLIERQKAQAQTLTVKMALVSSGSTAAHGTTLAQQCAQKFRPAYESLLQLPRFLPKVGLHPVSVCACLLGSLALGYTAVASTTGKVSARQNSILLLHTRWP
jgi:hypothetical protein